MHNHPPYGIKIRCNEEMLVYLYRPADMIMKIQISFLKISINIKKKMINSFTLES